MLRRAATLLLAGLLAACGTDARRRGNTVLYASGADLQSINPLFTIHPLARQVQRYVLLTTLVRRDSAMRIAPYLARHWSWSEGGRRLTLILYPGLRWEDGAPTTARDAAWTLTQARDPGTGYPRQTDLRLLARAAATDDTTLVLDFGAATGTMPDVLTDLAILPAHLLDSIPAARLRQAAWNERPVGNGPFRFIRHDPNRRWVFERNGDFPAALGGPPLLERLVIAVVDEPMTKLAGLTSGELDFAALQPAYATFAERDPALVVREYPVLFTTGIVFNTRRPPFDALAQRRRVADGVDRRALVDGFAYGFATPADGPVPPELPVPSAQYPVPDKPDFTDRALGTGHSQEAPLRFELVTVGSGEAALEQMLQAQLARGGITVVIRQLELSAFLDRVYSTRPDFQAAVLGTPGDPDLGYLRPLAVLSGLPVPEGTDRLLRFYQDSVPVAFLYHAQGLQGVNRRVRGVELGLRGELATVAQWSVR
ncbi:MAG TPA: ABC transporter substrate-binding protein [Gemmatimonadales bacterium]|jgi:peptide/nickel transport system substrate-binding protein